MLGNGASQTVVTESPACFRLSRVCQIDTCTNLMPRTALGGNPQHATFKHVAVAVKQQLRHELVQLRRHESEFGLVEVDSDRPWVVRVVELGHQPQLHARL